MSREIAARAEPDDSSVDFVLTKAYREVRSEKEHEIQVSSELSRSASVDPHLFTYTPCKICRGHRSLRWKYPLPPGKKTWKVKLVTLLLRFCDNSTWFYLHKPWRYPIGRSSLTVTSAPRRVKFIHRRWAARRYMML